MKKSERPKRQTAEWGKRGKGLISACKGRPVEDLNAKIAQDAIKDQKKKPPKAPNIKKSFFKTKKKERFKPELKPIQEEEKPNPGPKK